MKLILKLLYCFLIVLTTPMVEYQIQNVSAQSLLQIPVRWCWVEGSTTMENPSLAGEQTAHDVLWRRHERVSDGIYIPQAWITFRSGYTTTTVPPTFPSIPDPSTTVGSPGDIAGVSEKNYTELLAAVNACTQIWQTKFPGVVGIVAVNINDFVTADGSHARIGGSSYAPVHSDPSSQLQAYAVMRDYFYQDICGDENTPLYDRKIVGHEFGHTLSLEHGNGIDDDDDGDLDEDTNGDGEPDEPGDSLYTSDTSGNGNLMQYGTNCPSAINSIKLTPSSSNGGYDIGQIEWILNQANRHIPDAKPSQITLPLGNIKADEIGEIPAAENYLDIDTSIVAIEPRKDSTTFALSTFGLIPDNLEHTLNYYFLVDLDNNSTTGISLEELNENISTETDFQGPELVGLVQLVPQPTGKYNIQTAVWKLENGNMIPIDNTNNNIKAKVFINRLNITPDPGVILTQTSVPVTNTVELTLSNELRGLVTSDAVRLETISESLNTGTSDNQQFTANANNFSLVPPEFPACQVDPIVGTFGQNIIAHASDLSPSSPVHVILGDEEVATGETDSTGSVFLNFQIPQGTSTGVRLITVGTGALTADCYLKVVPPDLFPEIPP